MKTLLILSMLLSALLFTGCEALVETRQPARYGRVYDRPGYYDDSRYYYRDGRRYDRYDRDNHYDRNDRYYGNDRYDRRQSDVVVVNRDVTVRNPIYTRSTKRVVKRPQTDKRSESRDRNSSDRARDERDKKKKEKDRDDN